MPPTQCQGQGLSQYKHRRKGLRAVHPWRGVVTCADRCVELAVLAVLPIVGCACAGRAMAAVWGWTLDGRSSL
jgi:hypothetical protein